jgi:hypothetical protein
MSSRNLAAALLAVLAAVTFTACAATVRVRVEGNTQTLFEGPVSTDGHPIRASSDTVSRRCDGTNNNAHSEAGPTPTAATVDAMRIIGQTFDGQWYTDFDDYFLQRWATDRENVSTGAYWGVLVNGKFTSVGGCQFRNADGDETLWAYDAFRNRPFLRLAAASDGSTAPSPPQSVVYVNSGRVLPVKVLRYSGAMDGAAQNLGPAVLVSVSPVTTASNGYQTVNTGSSQTRFTNTQGVATYTFPGTGWFRIKATGNGYVRSNRLDVCVRPTPSTNCGALPADAAVRTPPGAAARALQALRAR